MGIVRHGPCAAVLIALSCSSSPRTPPPVALEDWSAAAVDAVCEWSIRCHHVPDRDTCDRMIDPKLYDTRRAEDAVAAERMAYDADAGGACVAATEEACCTATPFADESCRELFMGLVAEGGACTSDYECTGGARCQEMSCGVQCCLGVCGAAPTGDPQPPVPADIGEDCGTHTDCVDEAYCETDGKCTAYPDEVGERCLIGCARGDLYCDVEILECRAFAGLGELCDQSGESAPACDPTWSFCSSDDTCHHRPGAGEACAEPERSCIPTTFCDDTGHCRPRGGAGAECDSSAQCDVVCDLSGTECVAYEVCLAE